MDETKAGQSGGVNLNADDSVNVGRDVAGRDIIYNIHTQGADPAVLKDLEERLNNFLAQFVTLYRQLEEWKDLHNVLQDLQVRFTTCRIYALELGRRDEAEGGVTGPARTACRAAGVRVLSQLAAV
ncbi:MAG: hypothetical protein HW378_1736 [Anaerolineales bacterium]|nr:hypothetical protein [Anaerolineales bacterium]